MIISSTMFPHPKRHKVTKATQLEYRKVLCEDEKRREYAEEIKIQIEKENIEGKSIDESWEHIRASIEESAKKRIGRKRNEESWEHIRASIEESAKKRIGRKRNEALGTYKG
ncbi:hypothetical protein QE152_g8466 [Popillia japonica]|uniref:Uncharacterized protein n=1 Tax=Popillia japonica TaxID=7064 RepID=A0AAW1MBU0_POPJA